MLNLRKYQEDCLDALREGFKRGNSAQILYAPTGAGKTEMAIALLKATRDKGNKSAMVLDRIILCDQTSGRLQRYDIDHGVLQSGHWRYRPHENIQVCSAQTLEKRGSFPGLSLLIVDECFPAGTKIRTPSGDKDISIVRCGDTVYNANGVGTVISVMIKPAVELMQLEFEDGTTIECTENHPIFTERGWVKASELEVGRVSYSIEGLRLLWESVYAEDKNGLGQRSGIEQLRGLAASRSLLKVLLEEVEKPNEQSGVSCQDEGEASRNKAPSDSAGWERQIAAAASACLASRTGGGLASRVSSANKNEASKNWLSNLLQTGHCQLKDDDWDRIGRWFSLLSGEESKRFEKDRISCFPRLERISRVERESITPVFNLHISGHPSYFANGKLVHNCHATRAQTVEFIKKNPEIKVIGLTATPFTKGLGKIYKNVISTVTTKQLVDEKILVPLRVFISKEIDMEGAKKVAGEWSQKETEARGMTITGDVVSSWVQKTNEIFGKPVKTIVFSSGVNHGQDLARRFAEAGYNFISVSYKDDDKYKKEVIEDFSKPDTEINGLIATDVLTKGFDVPDVLIGVSARPFSKSLSSHIQQMGRVMRGYPGKEFAVWIDHSGNYIRFREDWDQIFEHGVDELDDGKEKSKPEKTDKEKQEHKCPSCSALWPTGSDTCLNCGYVKKSKSMVSEVPGELRELQGKVTGALTKEQFWAMCKHQMVTAGWSNGRAAHTFKEKFGVWPRNLDAVPTMHPNTEFDRFVKAKLIRYLKGMRRI